MGTFEMEISSLKLLKDSKPYTFFGQGFPEFLTYLANSLRMSEMDSGLNLDINLGICGVGWL